MDDILRATIASSKADIKRGNYDGVIETSALWSTEPKRHFYDYTLLKQIQEANADNMEGIAVSFFDTKMSYRQLIYETVHLAIAFRNAGVKAGDVVPICTITTPAIVPILLALCEIGAVSMWLYADSTIEEISKYVNRVNAKIFITGIGTEIIDRSAVTTVVELPTMYLESAQHTDSNVVDYFDFIESGKGADLSPRISFNSKRPCVIVQSSGTTGAPKLIVHTLGNIRNFLEKYNHTDWDLSKGKVALNSMPPWIAYGLLNALFSCLCFGMEVRLALEPPGKGFCSVYDNIKEIDVAFTTPWHLKYVLEHLKPSERSIIKLSTVVTGGDKISADEGRIVRSRDGRNCAGGNSCDTADTSHGTTCEIFRAVGREKPGRNLLDTDAGDRRAVGRVIAEL